MADRLAGGAIFSYIYDRRPGDCPQAIRRGTGCIKKGEREYNKELM